MTLVPWNPFSYMSQFSKDMSDLMEKSPFKFGGGEQWPKTDIYQTESQVELKVELPGVPKENINLYIDDNMIRISGAVQRNNEFKEEHIYRSERFYGSFSRDITLPTDVKPEEARAEFKDGVLTVSIPKNPAQAKGRKIDIQ